ncbi:hypothetical protein BKA70DRAFT_178825 [Coprinopsis sp. MPI-PUGE-AT-0042]|nr:hypothetical protein BKA70DRAFT_178825 [Coprinopsis sp. MPI-PUGE-AT-0042]
MLLISLTFLLRISPCVSWISTFVNHPVKAHPSFPLHLFRRSMPVSTSSTTSSQAFPTLLSAPSIYISPPRDLLRADTITRNPS